MPHPVHRLRTNLRLPATLLATVFWLTACGTATGPQPSATTTAPAGEAATAESGEATPATADRFGKNPNRYLHVPGQPEAPPAEGVRTIEVPAFVHAPAANYRRGPVAEKMAQKGIEYFAMDPTEPRRPSPPGSLDPSPSAAGASAGGSQLPEAGEAVPAPKAVSLPSLSIEFGSVDYGTNITENGGFAFIPADPIAAAGPNHVVSVVNTVIQFLQKDGTVDFTDSLADFFSAESPDTFTFDPKVLFDPLEGRFVVVTLEREDDGAGGSTERSEILLAVSDDADPNGTWCTTTIDAKTTIDSVEHWADYPGFATDEEAVYVTANMFAFTADGGSFGGVRLWTIDKGVGSSGFYDCGAATVVVSDPYDGGAGGVVETTTMPAQIHGTAPAGVGTFLVSYSGITNGVTEAVQVVRVDDPLGTPTFTQEFVDFGDVEDFSGFPDAPQSGTATLLETNDRRALDAEWFDDSVWLVGTVNPKSGDTDSGEVTAYWWELDTSTLGSTSLVQDGYIFGDDAITDLYTFFPSVAVNGQSQVGFGYSGSASSIFPSSFYTLHKPGDSAGSTQGTGTLESGTAFYERFFCGSSNRWGDYSGTATDPVDGCFWIYNKHAMSRGSGVDCNMDMVDDEDGRWSTRYGKLCPTDSCPADAFLADLTISGTDAYRAATRLTTGDAVAVDASADVTFTAAELIVLGSGFSVGSNASFVAEISATPCL